MTKFFIALLMLFSGLSLQAQKLDEINKLMEKKQFREAKEAIDKTIADPANATKPDPWYFKGRIYNSLSYEPTTQPAEGYDLKTQAYEAFKKNQELDNKDLRLKLEGYKSYLDLYFGFFDLGAKFFNDKEYDKAYNAFQTALKVKDYIIKKEYTFTEATLYPLDTALVLNTAIAAMQSTDHKNDAITYYKKLTDANVAGDSYKDVYEYLADLYMKKGDTVSLMPIIEKGKKLYPSNEYWTGLELDIVRKKGNQAELFAKYEEVMNNNPTNFISAYNYAIELYNAINGRGEKPADEAAAKTKLTEVLNRAIANDKGIDATLLMSKHLYNLSSDLSIDAAKIKSTKPEDVKKKAELVAAANKQMDEFLTYAEKASTYYENKADKSNIEKAKYQELLVNMIEIYNYKKDTKKAAETEKKKASIG